MPLKPSWQLSTTFILFSGLKNPSNHSLYGEHWMRALKLSSQLIPPSEIYYLIIWRLTIPSLGGAQYHPLETHSLRQLHFKGIFSRFATISQLNSALHSFDWSSGFTFLGFFSKSTDSGIRSHKTSLYPLLIFREHLDYSFFFTRSSFRPIFEDQDCSLWITGLDCLLHQWSTAFWTSLISFLLHQSSIVSS